jgi:putative membrane protein
MHDSWYWWMPFHGLIWLLMVAAIVVGVVVLIRYLWHGAGHPGPGLARSRALEHLDERYARGEIDRDEFFERRRVLRGEPHATGESGPP